MATIRKVWVYYVEKADTPKGYARYMVAGPPQTNDAKYLEAKIAEAKQLGAHYEVEAVEYDEAPPPQGEERTFSPSLVIGDARGESAVSGKAQVDAKRSQFVDALKNRVVPRGKA